MIRSQLPLRLISITDDEVIPCILVKSFCSVLDMDEARTRLKESLRRDDDDASDAVELLLRNYYKFYIT